MRLEKVHKKEKKKSAILTDGGLSSFNIVSHVHI